MNRRKVNTGAAAANSCSQVFSFPVLAHMDRCLFIRGASRKVVCKVGVEIRAVCVHACALYGRGFSALKRSLSFLNSYIFHLAQTEGQFCSGGLQDSVVSPPASTQEECYIQGKVQKDVPTQNRRSLPR